MKIIIESYLEEFHGGKNRTRKKINNIIQFYYNNFTL